MLHLKSIANSVYKLADAVRPRSIPALHPTSGGGEFGYQGSAPSKLVESRNPANHRRAEARRCNFYPLLLDFIPFLHLQLFILLAFFLSLCD